MTRWTHQNRSNSLGKQIKMAHPAPVAPGRAVLDDEMRALIPEQVVRRVVGVKERPYIRHDERLAVVELQHE